MAKENNSGVFIDAHNDKRGTSHVDFYGNDPKDESHDPSIHIKIRNDKTGEIVEKDNGVKTITKIDLNII